MEHLKGRYSSNTAASRSGTLWCDSVETGGAAHTAEGSRRQKSFMKVIIAGSRSIAADVEMIDQAVKESGYLVTEVISGMARGPDLAAVAWAESNGIPCKKMPADWGKYGKKEGILRNAQMAMYADALILIWDGASNGSRNMLNRIYMEPGKPVFVKIVGEIKVDNPRMQAQVFGF